jgi:hypothetical protein
MKQLITVLSLAFFINSVYAVETKQVCHDKNGKKVCKTIKIHEKLAGATVVPTKKK